jgi:hypothetical protein
MGTVKQFERATDEPEQCETEYRFRKFYIPSRMMGGLRRYVDEGILPGDFLTAVLRNDLRAACQRADDENLENLPAFVCWLYNEAPGGSWGSPERVQAYSEAKRAQRAANEEAR